MWRKETDTEYVYSNQEQPICINLAAAQQHLPIAKGTCFPFSRH